MNFTRPSTCSRLLTVAGVAGVAAAFYGAPAQAQTTEMDALRAQLAELQKRLDELAAQQATQQKALDEAKPPVATKSPIKVSGLLQVHLLDFFNQGGTSDTRRPDTFRLRRGEIRITAPQITDRIAATVMFDPAKDTTSGRARNNILQEIVISYDINKKNRADIGQFKIPVGYESLVSSSALPLVERPLIFTSRDPFDGGYGDVRDTGVQLTSNFSDFEARLGVFNGVGDRQNALALSDEKAILGRLAYTGVKNLTLGVSGGIGNTGTNVSVGDATLVRRADRTLFNLFGAYNKDKVYAAAEYLRGDAVPIRVFGAGQTTADPVVVAGRDIEGYYATLGYMFTPKLQGLFRYDNLDTNRSISDSKQQDYTLGLNYFIKGREARVQFNVIDHNADANARSGRDGVELRTAFQASF